jgi:hypothetical protein
MIALRGQQEQALAAKGADTSSGTEAQKSAFPGGLPSFAEALWVLRTARSIKASTSGYVKEDIERLASRMLRPCLHSSLTVPSQTRTRYPMPIVPYTI